MDDSADILELRKLNKEYEIAEKKLKEAKARLQSVQKQCDESKMQIEKTNLELETLNSKKENLNRSISAKKEKETHLMAECEKMAKKLESVMWKRKLMATKLELENHNRQRYEKMMTTSIEPASFLEILERRKNIQEMKELQTQLDLLQEEVLKKQNLYTEREKIHLEAQKSYDKSLESVEETKKNIASIEVLIRQQEEELEKLSNDEAIHQP